MKMEEPLRSVGQENSAARYPNYPTSTKQANKPEIHRIYDPPQSLHSSQERLSFQGMGMSNKMIY